MIDSFFPDGVVLYMHHLGEYPRLAGAFSEGVPRGRASEVFYPRLIGVGLDVHIVCVCTQAFCRFLSRAGPFFVVQINPYFR